MWCWLIDNWPQAVTWLLIVAGWPLSYIIATRIANRSSSRTKAENHQNQIQSLIDRTADQATTYWVRGRQAPTEDSELEFNILAGIDRIEADIEDLKSPRHLDAKSLDAIIEFRRSITSDPWQSTSRTPLSPNDERLLEISTSALTLSRRVRSILD